MKLGLFHPREIPMDNGLMEAPEIRLAELLIALSHALDMTEGQPQGHSVRCCWIGLLIAEQFGLNDLQTSELCYTILLKDLGCSSNAARICQLYLADDLTFKKDYKLVNGSLPQALRFVLSHTGLKSGLAERFRAIINIFQNGGEISKELIETRCQRGADIARKMRFSENVCAGIANLDEHWDGGGMPLGIAGTSIPWNSQIALMAQVIDVFQKAEGEDAARKEIGNRIGTWFDPALAAAFQRAAERPSFWDSINEPDLPEIVFALIPQNDAVTIDEDYLDDISQGFAEVVDTKSSYTRGHSERVALYTDLIAEEMGFTQNHRRWLRRAALLHDIGKLGVSNMVLDKPGKLDAEEMEHVREHASNTELILSRIAAFAKLAPIAAAHHERLDGSGYPKRLIGDQIAVESRILAVADIFDALTAERPYRAAWPIPKALAVMEPDVGRAIDAQCFAALKRALKRVESSLAA